LPAGAPLRGHKRFQHIRGGRALVHRSQGAIQYLRRYSDQACGDRPVSKHKGRDLKPGTLRGLIDDMGLSVEKFLAML